MRAERAKLSIYHLTTISGIKHIPTCVTTHESRRTRATTEVPVLRKLACARTHEAASGWWLIHLCRLTVFTFQPATAHADHSSPFLGPPLFPAFLEHQPLSAVAPLAYPSTSRVKTLVSTTASRGPKSRPSPLTGNMLITSPYFSHDFHVAAPCYKKLRATFRTQCIIIRACDRAACAC